jgi:GT2 family glycosyltransferase
MSEGNGKAYVALLNWNNWQDTIACLQSVYGLDYPDFQVIVVDNGSTDDSVERICAWAAGTQEAICSFTRRDARAKPIPVVQWNSADAPPAHIPTDALILIRNDLDIGVPGYNSCMRYVMERDDHAFFWLLNNDTEVHPDSLKEMVAMAGQDSARGMIGSKLLYFDKPDIIQATGGGSLSPMLGNVAHRAAHQPDDGSWDKPAELDFVTGASLLFTRDSLKTAGLFDEGYFLTWEDVHLNVTARRKGYQAWYCPSSIVWHKEGASVGRVSAMIDYYWVRNGLTFTLKFYPMCLPMVIAAYCFKYTVMRPLRRMPMNYRAFLKGIWHFLLNRKGEQAI